MKSPEAYPVVLIIDTRLKALLENSENDNVDKLKSNPHKTTVEKTIMPRKTNI